MAVSNQEIIDYLLANPGLSDAKLASDMATYGISPAQLSQATGTPENEIIARAAATVPNGQAVLLGDTWVQPQYQISGSGEDQQIGGIESIQTYKTSGDVNSQVPTGTTIKNFTPEGSFTGTTQTTESGGKSFFGGLLDVFKDPVVLAALAGGYGAGLFGGAGAGLGAAGTAGMSAAELAQLDLALGGAGGSTGATSLANALATGADVATLTNLTGGSGVTTGIEAGITADSVAEKLAADAFEVSNAGASALNPTGTVTPTTPITPTTVTPTAVTPTTVTPPTSIMDGLTATQLANLAKAGVSLATLFGTNALINNQSNNTAVTTPSAGTMPTQTVPLNTQDYYNAIQQNYNSLMPSMPRDVASPLAAWYNSKYGS